MKGSQKPLGSEQETPSSRPTHGWMLFLVVWVVLVLVLCSVPWWVESPRWARVRWIPLLDVIRGPYWVLRDAIVNFLLYMPLGVAYARLRAVAGVRPMWEAALLGLSLSMTCELYQVFSPVRFPSMTDVLTNTIGAFSGASIVRKCSPRKAIP